MWELSVLAWIALGCSTLVFGWLIKLFVCAPYGREDERGWHFDRNGAPDQLESAAALRTGDDKPLTDNLPPGHTSPISA